MVTQTDGNGNKKKNLRNNANHPEEPLRLFWEAKLQHPPASVPLRPLPLPLPYERPDPNP